jgi:hypothetical protein
VVVGDQQAIGDQEPSTDGRTVATCDPADGLAGPSPFVKPGDAEIVDGFALNRFGAGALFGVEVGERLCVDTVGNSGSSCNIGLCDGLHPADPAVRVRLSLKRPFAFDAGDRAIDFADILLNPRHRVPLYSFWSLHGSIPVAHVL